MMGKRGIYYNKSREIRQIDLWGFYKDTKLELVCPLNDIILLDMPGLLL